MNITSELYTEWLKLPPYTIITDPDTHSLENKAGEFYYTDDLFFTMPDPNDPTKVVIGVVLKGTIVNGASIPWFIQWLIPKEGKYNRPSGVHDDGYKKGGILIVTYEKVYNISSACIMGPEYSWFSNTVLHKMKQQRLDYLYLKLMEGRDVPKWNRNTQYRGLRLGGWVTWNKYRKQDAT